MQETPAIFNPHLQPWRSPRPDNVTGNGVIEQPGEARNLIWQTRKAEPTLYENDFGNTLEQVFDAGATTLAEVVAGLNRCGFRTPDGSLWTEAVFQAAVRQLAG